MEIPDFSATRFDPYDPGSLPVPKGDFWVFGYGSLMWNPGFKVQQSTPARLFGYHRRLCLWSIHYRGTARSPGLVLGLDRGGSCNGIAFRIAPQDIQVTLGYLQDREMLNNAYLPMLKKVYLPHGISVHALTFISRQEHPQFAAGLTLAETVSVVLEAEGTRGNNCEYVTNTVRHLNECGIKRSELHTVAEYLS